MEHLRHGSGRGSEATASISGTDVHALLPGGHRIAHDVDVRIGGERLAGDRWLPRMDMRFDRD